MSTNQKYHINNEGKVYPCKARVLKCPYGSDMHANTKEELYYKLMKNSSPANPTKNSIVEINELGRMINLHSASAEIAVCNYPVEAAIATLSNAMDEIEKINPDTHYQDYEPFRQEVAYCYAEVINAGLKIPFPEGYIPDDILAIAEPNIKAKKRLFVNKKSKENMYKLRQLANLNSQIDRYNFYLKYRLTEENKEATLGWIKEDFYKFSHDLNTSKMITQPVFYGDINKAEEVISSLDNYELLSAYDDMLISDSEIIENVKLANNFEYKYRRDLTPEANNSMKSWYDRNKKIYENWRENTPKRVLLSIKLAKELDKRDISRQDNALGRK